MIWCQQSLFFFFLKKEFENIFLHSRQLQKKENGSETGDRACNWIWKQLRTLTALLPLSTMLKLSCFAWLTQEKHIPSSPEGKQRHTANLGSVCNQETRLNYSTSSTCISVALGIVMSHVEANGPSLQPMPHEWMGDMCATFPRTSPGLIPVGCAMQDGHTEQPQAGQEVAARWQKSSAVV